MTTQPRSDRPHSGTFIRWSSASRGRRRGTLPPDPGFVIDRRRLNRCLNDLEGLSGE